MKIGNFEIMNGKYAHDICCDRKVYVFLYPKIKMNLVREMKSRVVKLRMKR